MFFFSYGPPNQFPKRVFGALSTLLSAAEHESNCIFLVGDFNAKHTSWDASAVTNSAGTCLYNLALEVALPHVSQSILASQLMDDIETYWTCY